MPETPDPETPASESPSSEPSPSEFSRQDAAGDPAESTSAGAKPAGKRDLAHWAALYVAHALELRRFLRGVLRSDELAEDALQSAFAKAIEVGETINPTTVKGWLFRVAMNEALAARRRQKTHTKTIERLAADELSPKRRVERDSPAGGLIHWEQVERVRQAVRRLSAEQQQVVRMRIDQNLTFAAIAAELKLPIGTVLSRMQAALRRLRNDLEEP